MRQTGRKGSGKGGRSTILGRFFHPLPPRKVRISQNPHLRLRIVSVVFLTIILAIGFAVLSDYLNRIPARARQRVVTTRIAANINSFVLHHFSDAVNFLSGSREIVKVLTGDAPPDNEDLRGELDVARGVLKVARFFVLDTDGMVVGCSTGGGRTSLTGADFSSFPCFSRALSGQSCRCVTPEGGSDEPSIFFSEPVPAPGATDPVGVLVVQTSIETIDMYLNGSDGMDVLLLSRDRIVFTSSRPDWPAAPVVSAPNRQSAESTARQPVRLPFSPRAHTVRYGGQRYLVQSVKVDLPGWQVVTLYPLSFPVVVVFIGECFLFAGAAIFIIALLHRYKEELLTEELRIGRERRRRAEESRQMTQRELKTILSASLVGIILVRDGLITSVNEKMCAILGYSEKEMLGSDVRLYFGDK